MLPLGFSEWFYLSLAVLGLHRCTGFSPVAAAGATLQLWVLEFLIVVASPCRAQALQEWASVVAVSGLWSTGEIVTAHRLIALWRVGFFPDQD